MEVNPGYKQTEVGVIPEEWDAIPLAGLCRSICDGTHFTPKYVDSGIPFYSVENVTADDFTNTKFISAEEHALLIKRCKPERGDILMTRITAGVLGDTRILDWDVNASIYVSLALLKPNDRVLPEYLYRYSRSTAFVRGVEKRGLANATPKKINMRDIGAIPIPVPNTEDEQRAIASALSDVDGLLGGLDRLIAKKRDLKQAAMQQLLTGQIRLPGFHGEWEMKQLGDVVKISKGQLITEGNAIPGAIPVIAGGKKPAYFHNKANRSGKTVTISASGASAGYVAFFDEPIFASDCSTISESEDYSIEFVYFQLQLKQATIYKAQTGGAQPHIHAADVNPIEVFWPIVPVQTAIASVLMDMDAEVAALEQRREKTRVLKHAMMQELLTGKTRLVPVGTAHV